MSDARIRGFSMIELVFVILIMGIMFAVSIPAYNSFRKTHDLKGAVQDVAAQLRLAREKAIATGEPQMMHFTYQYSVCNYCDYHIHNGSAIPSTWTFPRGVTYYWGTGTINNVQMTKTGRAVDVSGNPTSGMIILQNQRGLRDTVLVQASGLVLVN